jgi:hypothetical protein
MAVGSGALVGGGVVGSAAIGALHADSARKMDSRILHTTMGFKVHSLDWISNTSRIICWYPANWDSVLFIQGGIISV